ncbi:MAG: hypothetical protein WCB11_07065 [Terriglobales bacterium]
MANRSGDVYGLTILSPILQDLTAETSHNCAIRMKLASLPGDESSPFAKVSSTHMARLAVMDDVVYVGMPSCEEHLKSQYLVFETNFDGELDEYLTRMAREIPADVDALWKHCWGYPGTKDVAAFIAYMKKCQITTTFYFADVNNHTVQETLTALQTQAAVAEFIERNQGKAAAELQIAFAHFLEKLRDAPPPVPGRPEKGGPPRIETNMKWATRNAANTKQVTPNE